MRVFWYQGGLHIEPESAVETEAMLVLLDGLRYERPPENDDPRTADPLRRSDDLGEVQGDLNVGL